VDDQDLERLLQRYRPVGPPPELRDGVIARLTPRAPFGEAGGARGFSRAAAEWMPAAAALVFAALFYWLAASEHAAVAARCAAVTPIDPLATAQQELAR
jgi:hypothetical protein